MELTRGSRVGPYEVDTLLGAGGMGEVYRARDTRLGRDVALKVIPASVLDPERVRRFEQEARAAGVLNHPNILTVHDVGMHEGRPYLVTELLEGETLRERLGRGPLTSDRVLDVGTQVALGLAAAHAKGIVHRDLKPENLFLTRGGRVKILDFGIAKLVEREQALDALATAAGTVAGVIVGTASYMSPEQVTGRAVDQRSDVFALGIVLHEMLAGQAPFQRNTSVESMTAVLNDEPPPLDAGRVPPTVVRLVQRCLEKEPEERFQSARDLAFALETLRTSGTGSSSAAAVRGGSASRLTLARLPWWWLLVACGAGAALSMVVLLRPRPDEPPRFTRVVRIVSTGALESSPVLSPDGKWLAYVSDELGRLDVWVRYLSGGRSINLTAGARDLYITPVREIGGIDISPDGSQIAFPASTKPYALANEQTTYVIDAPLGGPPRKLLDHGIGARFSPDGTQLGFVLPGGTAGGGL